MSKPSTYELVRRDLLAREQQDLAAFGAPAEAYRGRAAILDAYDSAIDLACYLRQVIESMTAGTGRFDRPQPTQTAAGLRRDPEVDVPEYGA